MIDAGREERISTLAARLRHPDPSQLIFQLAEIAGERTYLRHGVHVGAGDVVIDAGAHVGVAALFFADLCGAAVVHCLEPVAPLCALLRANVAGTPACVVHELGLSDVRGAAEITYYPGAGAMSGLHADPQRDGAAVRAVLRNLGRSAAEAEAAVAGRHEPHVLPCMLTTLSAFLAAEAVERVSLLKIDVERAEAAVLRGIGVKDWQRIDQVVCEAHDGRASEIAATLRGRGFAVAVEQEMAMRGSDVEMVYARR